MDVETTLVGVEARATLGWICPRCHSVHAPFVSTCPTCDASKHPRVQAWLLKSVKDTLAAVPSDSSDVTINKHNLQRLVDAASPK